MSRRTKIIGTSVIAVAVLLFALGVGVWVLFLSGDEPDPVSLDDAVTALGTSTATETSADTSATAAATGTATEQEEASTAGSADAAAASWSIDPAAGSFTGYRVDEELARIGFATAVGRTTGVEGSLQIEDGVVTTVDVVADLTRLESDENFRDNALRDRGLETNTYPEATFSLTEPITIDDSFFDGTPLSVEAQGELTLHGVTQPVTITLEGQYVDGTIVVVGSTHILFADYGIEAPTSQVALSVEDNGIMEFQVYFVPA